MHNGDISDNIARYYGGGVYLANESTLTMNNGNILNNTATNFSGGGVYANSDSTFTLNNGTISRNIASSSSILVGGNGVYTYEGEFTMTGGYLDDEIKYSSSEISITGGYFSFNPSDYLTSNDYVAINIENLGGKSFDQDYVDGYSFAVYKVGTTLEEDIPTLTVIEDITVCPNLDYEDMIQINVNYDVVTYSYTISGEGLPTGNLIYKVTATFNNVMVEIEGVKTYYEGPMTTEFEVKMSHTPVDEVTVENEVDATCYKDGGYDEVIYCIVCGDELSREAVVTDLATGHSYSNELNNDAYYHWYAATCEHSNEVKDRAEHTYGDWEATSDGIEQRTCSVCGYLETNVIATSESGLTTGEITGIAIGGVALVGVIANLIIMLMKSKKNS